MATTNCDTGLDIERLKGNSTYLLTNLDFFAVNIAELSLLSKSASLETWAILKYQKSNFVQVSFHLPLLGQLQLLYLGFLLQI